MPGIATPNAVFSAKTHNEQPTVISLENAETWIGPLIGGFFQPLLVRLPDGRWFVGRLGYEGTVGCMNPDGGVGPKNLPLFQELAPIDIPLWCEANGVEIPAEPVADLGRQAPPSPTASPAYARPAAARSADESGIVVQPATVADGQIDEPARLLADTFRCLKRCRVQAEIVRYLWGRPDREAPLDMIASDVYRVRPASLNQRDKTVRKAVERTRDNLEKQDSPLRLIITANSVQLVHATTPE
jgi:hypothetical protein